MKEYKAGTYILHKGYKPFVPSFINDDIDWKLEDLANLLQDASLWLGKLNSYSDLVPDINFFIKMYATKEATNSNRIEGTRTTFEDAITPIEQIKPELKDDWHEVQNYIKAINYSVERLKELPVSMRLIKEAHRILLQGVRGEHKTPGEVRKSQNWIGGSSLTDAFFVPPEPNMLPDLLSDIEKFLHNENLRLPELIKAGIAHYQFETIHPFLDGNGRTGRLLIILYLISTGLLNKPVLYISDFFERNRMSYYDSLSMVKQTDNMTQWLKFFLNGIVETSKSSIKTFDEIIRLRKEVEIKILQIGKRVAIGQKLLELLYSKPKVNAKIVSEELGISIVSSNNLLKAFVENGILEEKTGYNRNRFYVFEDYIKIFR
ncbi:Fic family protein [bacterium]|nr:Fic family protein [bacterium]